MLYKYILLGVFLSTVFLSAVVLQPMNVKKDALDVTLNPENVTLYPKNVMLYPIHGDRDGDGVDNSKDAFPGNPNEWLDTDHDGIGNNADNDDDGDGISDSVEKANGMNPLNASDAQADWDNDGFSNIIEINAGTNIKNAKSKPTWTPVIMGEIIIFIPAGV